MVDFFAWLVVLMVDIAPYQHTVQRIIDEVGDVEDFCGFPNGYFSFEPVQVVWLGRLPGLFWLYDTQRIQELGRMLFEKGIQRRPLE